MIPVCDEPLWLCSLSNLPRWDPPELPTIVISPHPDDETLGAGGLIAMQRRRGVPVRIVAVTDGEAAYRDADGLGEVRSKEQESALEELGVAGQDILRLHLPDGSVSSCEEALAALVTPLVDSATLLIAPWSLDPHPDHEACGRVAHRVAADTEVTLLSYVFWAWHRNHADSLTALPLVRLELDELLQTRRAGALSRHRSQLEWKTGEPVLRAALLKPAQRSFETFILNG